MGYINRNKGVMPFCKAGTIDGWTGQATGFTPGQRPTTTHLIVKSPAGWTSAQVAKGAEKALLTISATMSPPVPVIPPPVTPAPAPPTPNGPPGPASSQAPSSSPWARHSHQMALRSRCLQAPHTLVASSAWIGYSPCASTCLPQRCATPPGRGATNRHTLSQPSSRWRTTTPR